MKLSIRGAEKTWKVLEGGGGPPKQRQRERAAAPHVERSARGRHQLDPVHLTGWHLASRADRPLQELHTPGRTSSCAHSKSEVASEHEEIYIYVHVYVVGVYINV